MGGGLAVILFFAAMIVLIIWCKTDDPAIASAFAAGCTGFIAAVTPVMRSMLKENGHRQKHQIDCEKQEQIKRLRNEPEEEKMKLFNIEYIPDTKIEALGMVKGTIVQTKHAGRDLMASMKTLVGGEIVGYTEMLNEARQIAVERMVEEAEALGADAVIGIRYGSAQVMTGAAEVIAYGTAVKILSE